MRVTIAGAWRAPLARAGPCLDAACRSHDSKPNGDTRLRLPRDTALQDVIDARGEWTGRADPGGRPVASIKAKALRAALARRP